MILPSDPEYIEAKEYKNGQRKMLPPFSTLADWIANEYGSPFPLVVRLDRPNARERDRYRLDVVLETEEQQRCFRDAEGLSYDHDKQQAIALRFKEIVAEQMPSKGFLFKLRRLRGPYIPDAEEIESLFVIFSAFERVARIEANDGVAKVEIEQMRQELGLWKIHRQFASVTFMFETAKEAERAERDGRAEQCRARYAEALRRYDEFGYFREHPIHSRCDSREVFEREYDGSWFKYTR